MRLFCVVGRHQGPDLRGQPTPTWGMVPAHFRDGRWVFGRDSAAKVCCCMDHMPEGTPKGWKP